MRFNLRQMFVFVALVAFLIVFVRPLATPPINSIRTAWGEQKGNLVFWQSLQNWSVPASFIVGVRPTEPIMDSGRRSSSRSFSNGYSISYYDARNLTFPSGESLEVRKGAPGYYALGFLQISGSLIGVVLTMTFYLGLIGGFCYAFKWAGAPAKIS